MRSNIFEKQATLQPATMRTVAERRFGDAESLRNTKDNARANGVAYLIGFVIEILLKAKLVEKFPTIARKRQHEVLPDEIDVWRLIWKQHDLVGMLDRMAELEAYLKKRGERDHSDYFEQLKKICQLWTIQARYSPRTMLLAEAVILLERVRTLKELLK